jgi:hypothetical protein
MALDKHGTPYYIDHANRRTQREKPALPAAAVTCEVDEESSSTSDVPPSPSRKMERRGSFSSLESISSLISTVSSLSLSSYNSAKAFLVGDAGPATYYDSSSSSTPSLTQRFWSRIRLGAGEAESGAEGRV